jgi:predicted anti-sigma-YlaC factor YlaD
MHGPIRDRLEELLNTTPPSSEVDSHLASCTDCRETLTAMKEHKDLLRGLRGPEELEPAPGFYARVMQRIEEGGVASIWPVFTEGPFGKWLAYASLAVALVLGTWVVGVEQQDGHLGQDPVFARGADNDMHVTGDQAHQRDVVLVNLAAYSEAAPR